MNLKDLITKIEKPEIYEPGSAFMWTDGHISKQLLDVHLNPEVDLASRKRSTIEKTANWILDTQKEKGKLNILDLGCGPGLYCELFAEQGHSVTGVDISKNSMEYAHQSAKDKKLDITYLNKSYLDLDLEPDSYDLVVLIYTDIGVLTPTDRDKLLGTIYKSLKKGGTFIFDVLKDHHFEQKLTPKNWEVKASGFWSSEPYLVLSSSFLYPEEKVILYQHHVIEENNSIETYRFWTHFFSPPDISKMLEPHHFKNTTYSDDILPKGELWNGDNVIFTVTSK